MHIAQSTKNDAILFNFRYLNPGGADPTQFYHHNVSEDHQPVNFHTPPPYHGMPPPMPDSYGYHDIGNMSIFQTLNNTLADIQKKLTVLEEKHVKTELALTEIQSSFDEMKENRIPVKSTSRKSPPGLSVRNHICSLQCCTRTFKFRPVYVKCMYHLMMKINTGILRGAYVNDFLSQLLI